MIFQIHGLCPKMNGNDGMQSKSGHHANPPETATDCGDQMAELRIAKEEIASLYERICDFQMENDQRIDKIQKNTKKIKDCLSKSESKTTIPKTQASEIPKLHVVTAARGKLPEISIKDPAAPPKKHQQEWTDVMNTK